MNVTAEPMSRSANDREADPEDESFKREFFVSGANEHFSTFEGDDEALKFANRSARERHIEAADLNDRRRGVPFGFGNVAIHDELGVLELADGLERGSGVRRALFEHEALTAHSPSFGGGRIRLPAAKVEPIEERAPATIERRAQFRRGAAGGQFLNANIPEFDWG